MSPTTIHSLLRAALEREIPSSEINLWPALQARLAAGRSATSGENMFTSNSARRWQRVALGAALVLSLFALALLSPQGRALAQAITQFFTRTASDSYHQEPSDLTFEDTTPFHAECGIPIMPRCTVEQARALVDFEIKDFRALPEDLRYIGATGGPDWIGLTYRYVRPQDGTLSVTIESANHPSDLGMGIAAPSAQIEQVQINGLPAEYFQGMLYQDEQGNVNWYPNDPLQTLRWEDNGSVYTLNYYSTVHPLSRDELVDLAAAMTLGE